MEKIRTALVQQRFIFVPVDVMLYCPCCYVHGQHCDAVLSFLGRLITTTGCVLLQAQLSSTGVPP